MKKENLPPDCTIHVMPPTISDDDITALFQGIVKVVKKKFELEKNAEIINLNLSHEKIVKELKEKKAEIVRLKNETKAASIVVTHQMSTITRTADRIIMLYNGKVVFMGTPEELLRQDTPYTKQFVTASLEGPMHMLKG